MNIDLNQPEPPAAPEAWEALVSKHAPLEERLQKLERQAPSGMTYPLVARESSCQNLTSLLDTEVFEQRLGHAPVWDVRAPIEAVDATTGNQQILHALAHGANALELRLSEVISCDWDTLFENVERSMVRLVLLLDCDHLNQFDVSHLDTFERVYWVTDSATRSFPPTDVAGQRVLSCLEITDAGGHSAEELAYILAATLTQVRGTKEPFNPSLYVTTGSMLFATIAKLRALRRLFGYLRHTLNLTESWELLTLSSPREWTQDAPWNNQLRGTASIMGASIGGATSIGILPATATLDAQRVALTAHSVAGLESDLGHVDDPARGSYLIESLTETLAQTAWKLFQDIESRGGLEHDNGRAFLDAAVNESAQRRQKALATRKRSYIGVSEFPSSEDAPAEMPSTLLGRTRDSQVYEAYRRRPKTVDIGLITVGSQARHLARKTFAAHALAAGGHQAHVLELNEATANPPSIGIFCGHEEDYEEHRDAILKIVGEAQNRYFIASKKALVDSFDPSRRLHLGMNLVSFLEALTQLEQEA